MKVTSVAQRITLMLSIALLSLIGAGSYGLWELGAAQDRFEFVQDNTVPSVKALDEARIAVERNRISTRDHMLSENVAGKEAAAKQVADLTQIIEKNLERYAKEYVADDTDRKMVEADRAALATYIPKVRAVLDSSNAQDVRKAVQLQKGISAELTGALNSHIEYNWKLAEDMRKANRADYNKGKWILITVILLALAASAVLGFSVIREIRMRLNRLSSLMTQVNETLDFTTRIKITRMDELGHSADAFNKLLDKMQANLQSISTSTQSVASAATLMTTSSNEVATASHQQSESASDMAATVEEMTVSINHVGERALEANRLSSESGMLAATGEKIIGQTVNDIREIAATVQSASDLIHGLEQHSQNISNVISVIKDVADQTNLLALNAAIEAARAGEQGRGFAVVADEVRKLAERTSKSTQEISETIIAMRSSASDAVASMQDVVEKVSKGVESAQVASNTIQQIGESSRTAVGMVEEITSAIREQASATNNIAVQVEKIAQMSEEGSAAAGHSAEAAGNLDRLALGMQQIVSAYKL